MSRVRDIANILSANTAMATDAEVTSSIASHAAAADPHTVYLKESEYNVTGKNLVINGAFDVWQRGTSFTGITVGNTYVADRWSVATAGTYNVYISRQLTNDTTNLPNIQYCLRYGRTAGTTGTNWNNLTTSFETSNSIPYAGKTVTLSFYARAGANFSSSGNLLHSFILSGTGTDQNANVAYTGQQYAYANHAITSTWQRFTNTYAVPSNATELAISIQYVPSGTAGANDWYEITGVQLELGSQPTNFSRAGGSLENEFSLCQRYYQRIDSTFAGYRYYGTGTVVATNQGKVYVPFMNTLRAVPSITVNGVSNTALMHGNQFITPSSVSADAPTINGTGLFVNGSGFTVGNGCIFLANNSTSTSIEINSEL